MTNIVLIGYAAIPRLGSIHVQFMSFTILIWVMFI